jgi:3-deoxy-D-manno-octulosonic-acid transferase
VSKIFTYIYFAVLCIVYIIALPFLVVFSFFKKYRESIPSRFFLRKNQKFTESGVWFHACSYGEVSSLTSLISTLKLDNENVNVSVITNTGYKRAKEMTENVRYLPFEIFLPFWITKQDVLVVTEAELWLMLFFIAKRKGTKTILINARVNDNSYHRYKKFRWFYNKLFENIDEVYAQSAVDETRLKFLGAKNIQVTGNIKNMNLPKVTKNYGANQKYEKTITLASTHIGEEKLILKQLGNINLDNTLVILVPRHPERFEAVHKLAQAWANDMGKTYCRFSKDGFNDPCDVMLCDVMGELVNIYAITDITILGGSFIEGVGGHNPVEPASFNNIIISGLFYYNQKELYSKVEDITICNVDEIAKVIRTNPPKAHIKHIEDNNIILESILNK